MIDRGAGTRRALLVYQASAGRLRRAASAVPPAALHRTAAAARLTRGYPKWHGEETVKISPPPRRKPGPRSNRAALALGPRLRAGVSG